MRITEATRFPHPVLRPNGNDFTSGEFDVRLEVEERPATGALTFRHEIVLTEPSIADLVTCGQASVGCFVRCNETYYSELRELSWPSGINDFPPGSLLNRVSIRPVIWLKEDLQSWNPDTIHPEFMPPVSIERASVIAVGPEYVISVGLAKFTPMESIFELSAADDLPDGMIRIDPEADRIVILVAAQLFQTINILRGQATGQAVLINAIYLPAVIELLDLLSTDTDQFSGRRWFTPFMAKCDAKGIDLSTKPSLLESAQVLLGSPARELMRVVAEVDQ